MKILLICIFALQNIVSSLTTTVEGNNCQKPIMCEFIKPWNIDYTFNISDVLERCTSVVACWYIFDMDNEVDSHVFEYNKNAIRELVAQKKSVYVIATNLRSNPWKEILDYECKGQEYTEKIDPFKDFIKKFSINGFIIDFPPIFGEIERAEDKILMFVNDMKKSITDLKIGLILNGIDYKNFTNPKVFNFTKVNNFVDHYMIDLTQSNDCNATTRKLSVNPITSTDLNVFSIESMSHGVFCSTMDPCKTIARLQVGVIKPAKDSEIALELSYSEYCSTGESNKTIWCSDASQTLYDQGKYVANIYSGISLSQLPADDYEESCNCKKFPVSNIIIDGFQGQTFTSCPALDQF